MKINLHTSHPSAFISSTFIDLQEERSAVAEILKDNGLNVNALDIKPASTESSKKEIIRGVKESDFVILTIGDRYGSILPRMTGSDTQSITWWEYQKVRFFGKPVVAYFQNPSYFDIDNHDDRSDPSYTKKRKLFERFKNLVGTKHNPAYFTDSYDLSEKVQKSLIPTYRYGIETMNRKNSELSDRVVSLERELAELCVKLG